MKTKVSVDEFLDALDFLPRCRNECRPEIPDERRCEAICPIGIGYCCTRLRGHSGSHVACGTGGRHELAVWSHVWKGCVLPKDWPAKRREIKARVDQEFANARRRIRRRERRAQIESPHARLFPALANAHLTDDELARQGRKANDKC